MKPALKWNKINLQNPSKLKEYTSQLHNKLINLAPKQETDEEWEQIKTATVVAAKEVIQTQGKLLKNKWWDEECWEIIQEKNEARKKLLQLKTRINWNTYINKRKRANKICIQNKKKWLSSKIIQIEENHRRNETKKISSKK